MSIGTTVIEIREFKEGHGQIIGQMWYLEKIFASQLSFDMCCTATSELNFQMYGENTNTIAIPMYMCMH